MTTRRRRANAPFEACRRGPPSVDNTARAIVTLDSVFRQTGFALSSHRIQAANNERPFFFIYQRFAKPLEPLNTYYNTRITHRGMADSNAVTTAIMPTALRSRVNWFSPDAEIYHHARLVKHARHARPTGCAWLRAASRSLRDPLTHSARGGVLRVSGRGTSSFSPTPPAGRTRNYWQNC